MLRRVHFILVLIVTLIGFASLPAAAQSGRTFYIDYSSGSNSNSGTEDGPWKTHPYMQAAPACTGTGSAPSYTHQAGDRFIFKGGESWPAACFTFAISSSGTSASSDYYGVDQTWFTGASWTRPKFDMANTKASAGPMLTIHGSYITVDNLELAHLKITKGAGAGCTDSNISANSGFTGQTEVLLKNLFIHDWTADLADFSSYTHQTGSICQSNGSTSTVDTVEMTDQNTAFVDGGGHTLPFGACFSNEGEIKNSNCHHVAEGEVGHFGAVHDSQFHDFDGNNVDSYATSLGTCPGGANNCVHTNGIHMSGMCDGSCEGPIYNNLFYNDQSGVTIFTCAATTIYNNVMWNNFNASILFSTSTNDCPGTTTSSTANIYNNTIDCSNGAGCFRNVLRTSGQVASIFNIRNNVFITNGTPTCYNNTGASCGNISASSVIDHNYTMPTSEASTYGFASSTKYAATSSDSHVTSAGANLSNACSAQLGDLCEDAEGAAWYGGSYQTRPLDSTAWTLGAYVFGGQSQSSKPNPPTNLVATVQ